MQAIYDQMWNSFVCAMDEGNYVLDPWLNKLAEDDRRGITALAYLEPHNSSLTSNIGEFLRCVRALEPDQYYHPLRELHITVLSIISCVSGFTLNDIDSQAYVDIFLDVVKQHQQPIEIEFRGITASPSCLLLQGFTKDNTLDELRRNLRLAYQASGLRTSIDSRYKIVTAHSSCVRFCRPLRNPQSLLALCQQWRTTYFGSLNVSEIELVFNNWYQNLSITQVLAKQSIFK
ncbi:hypothetical protein LDJ79_04485 [Vibrio tritonius]|uniref:Uncharacterized protein n=1 Tax=Vibrio tritonius TaxID=1435069 RepID=A0ABS7YJX2_9VIBR|nr:hypothetical protein [Vibrio tritonius]MCA2015357.1 hypothetical protein [Vibrio tritonius]